jgi:hypothetical protein
VSAAASLFLVAATSGSAISFHDAIRTASGVVTLGDAAELVVLPPALRERAASLVLVNATRSRQSIAHNALAARARSRMPALGPWLSRTYAGMVRMDRSSPRSAEIVAASSNPDAVAAGEAIVTRLRIGGYMIERNARALQAARAGERFFVRTPDGVLSPYCCERAQ